MNCLDYRRALETEPQRVTPEMQAHAQSCADCTAWTGEMRAFEERLRRALAIGVPPARDLPLPRVTSVSRRFALAASLLGAIALASLIWLSFPRDTLAAEVVAHVAQEPQSWLSHEALPLPAVEEVLERSNSSAHFVPGSVTYARNCWFRGHLVPHLVVGDPEGAVTVLILASERVSGKVRFEEEGYHGVIMPAPHGSLAVLSRDEMRLEAVAARMLEALGP